MDDFAPFESPKLLVNGAKTNIEDFEAACNAFIRNSTHDTIRYVEPKSGDKVVKFRFHHRMPPTLRLSAYRILNDLRHALDQAVCDAALMLGRASPKGIYFPFGKSLKNLADEAVQKCKSVHPELVAFILNFEPHLSGDGLLYALSSLAGPNKHQRIIGMSLNNTGLEILPSTKIYIPHPDIRPLPNNKWNELRNELEFMRTGPGASGQIDAVPVLEIVLGDGKTPLSGPAAVTLSAMASRVTNIVSSIEVETARIKDA